MSGHVASQIRTFPPFQGTMEAPSGLLLSERKRPEGSRWHGIFIDSSVRFTMSLSAACLELGLDEICFFSCLLCFSFVLNICTHFAFQCTHFAFYCTHFASYFNLKFQHYYVIKLPKIHQNKKTMNVKHKWYIEEKQ